MTGNVGSFGHHLPMGWPVFKRAYTRKDDRDEDREVAEEEDVARRRGVRNVDVVAANMTD